MKKLIRYHTIEANPDYYWENNFVATKLRKQELKTYTEYVYACKEAGCVCYNEGVFEEYLLTNNQ